MKFKILALILFLSSSVAGADARAEKIRSLMEVEGIQKSWTRQMDSFKKINAENAQKILDKMFLQINPDDSYKEKFKAAFDKFNSSIEAPLTSINIVSVWSKCYGDSFTDEELDQLLAFYTSPLGKKRVKVYDEASISLINYFQAAMKPALEAASTQYFKELSQISKECSCAK